MAEANPASTPKNMMTIHTITTNPKSLPYSQQLRVQVVAVKQEEQVLRFSLADETGCCRASCKVQEKWKNIKAGNSIILMNYSIFKNTIILKANTKIGLCKSLAIPSEIAGRARALITPPPTPTSPVKQLQQRNEELDLISIEGTITDVSKSIFYCVFVI